MPRYEEKIFGIIDNYIKKNQQKVNQEDLYKELVLDEKAPLRRLVKSNPIKYCFVIHRPSKNDNNKEETLLGLLFENNFNTVINKLLDNEFSEKFIDINTIKNSREILAYDQLIKGLHYENSSESLIKLAKRNNDLVACIKNLKKNIQATAKSELEKTKLALQPEIKLIEANQKKALQEETQERDKKRHEEIKRAVHAAEQSKIEAQLQAVCEKEQAQLQTLNVKHNVAIPPELLGYQFIKQPISVSKNIIHDPLNPIASGWPGTFFSSPKTSLTPGLNQLIAGINQRPPNNPDLEPEFNFEDEDAVSSQNFPCKKV